MKKFFADFKKFISRGNVIDLAVGVVVGGAFGKITTSLVNDIIMPLISLLFGGKSVADWKWVIQEATYDDAGTLLTAETALHYGSFIQTIIDFLIIAFSIFLILRIIMNARKGLEELTGKTQRQKRKQLRALVKSGKTREEAAAVLAAEEAEAKAKAEAEAAAKAEAEAAAAKAADPAVTNELLGEIRDLLRKEAQADAKQD